MSGLATMPAPEPIDLTYEADLLGNIQQALAGLQGFDVMALELIQNADDSGAGMMCFDVRDDALVVRNDGQFSNCGLGAKRCPWEEDSDPDGIFRSCNFHAISRVGSRNKIHASGQIGRFGIGFVSVYQITDAPIIRSVGIEMQLDPLRGTAPTTRVLDGGGTEFELPWATMPSPTRQALNASPTPNNVATLLVEAIGNVMASGLFFLRHLRCVELRQNGALERSVIIRRDGGLVTLEIAPDERVERWKILTRDAGDLAAERDIYTDYPTLAQLDRSLVVHVAIPLSGDSIEGLLYAYLPTEQKSGMPLHINGDFFPHPNRRSIVLSGEQHERYWNELLLDTAAHAIGEAFEELRDLLGGLRLWELGNKAFALRHAKGFSEFWNVFSEFAKARPSVWIVGDKWCSPARCHLPPEQMTEAELAALANVGVKLIHPDLRPLWTVLSSVGVTPLKLSTMVDALEARGERPEVTLDDPHLRPLWTAIDIMIEQGRSAKDFDAVLARLKAAAFLLDAEGELATINELWRPPTGVQAEEIRNYVADCPMVHREVANHSQLWNAIDVYGFDDLAGHLAKTIVDVSSAATVIGTAGPSVRRFYDLVTAFEIDPRTSRAGVILADVPMLRTIDGFVPPSRGRLPGGFADPIGYFELVDMALISERMDQLARTVLGVQVLSFKEYVEDHLEDILAPDLGRDQYAALILAIVEHQAELDAEGGLEPLAEQAFIRTRAGSYARPRDCYYWSAALEILLGDHGDHWVEDGWMPAGRAGGRFRDLLNNRLGMRATVSTKHIVDRVSEIAKTGTIDEIADRTAPIVRHILERWSRLSPSDRRDLEKLREIAFLPAAVGGERVAGKRYQPSNVYRAFRATGFSSQVPIVDLLPLRQGGGALPDFLDFLGMPGEPPTEKVVAHLEYCMAKGIQAPDTTYAILNERLETTDVECIDRLVGTDFIYDGELERYLPADKVFWIPPPFGGHWHAASSRMRQREPLYRRLGVADIPAAANYANLLKEIAREAHPSTKDADVHARCVAWLADALDQGSAEAEQAIDGLHEEYALLNLNGEPVWTEDAVWADSEWLAEPFGNTLDERLVAQPLGVHRTAAARFFRQMSVVPLSEIARLRLSSEPDQRPGIEATRLLRERDDLLLWLAPNQEFRRALSDILSRIEIRFTDNLQLHAEILEFDPPVRSPVSLAASFYDPESNILHVRAQEGQSVNWAAAFRGLIAQLERHTQSIDMRPVVMTATFVMSLSTWSAAEQELRNSGFSPFEKAVDELPLGEQLGDAPTDPVEDDVLEGHQPEPTDQGLPSRKSDEDDEEESADGEGDDIVDGRRADGAGSPTPANGDVFKSKDANGTFGADPKEASVGEGPRGGEGVGRHGSTAHSGGLRAKDGSRHQDTKRERQTRRSRMLAYVSTGADRSDPTRRVGDDDDTSDLIDIAAITAVLKYEQTRGCLPEEQPHANHGYDIISRTADGASRRLIEVKGLEGDWTERGIKLSHVQYSMAETHPEEFWIYVVENARDLQRQRVSAIANPFSKVEEYWFDDKWRLLSEETATAQDISIRIGAKVAHDIWGTGQITAVEHRGIAYFLTVDFGSIQGRRYIPYSSNLKFVD
jgi:hypothetical protein